VRTTRRSGLPIENPLVFYAKRAWEIVAKYAGFAGFALYLDRLHKKIKRDPAAKQYTDLALQPVIDSPEEEALQLYSQTESAKNVAAKTKALASRGGPKLVQLESRRVA